MTSEMTGGTTASWNFLRSSHPLWMCGLRPFLLLAMGSAIGLLAWWSLVLAAGMPAPLVAGGALVWHVHELVFGFAMAAVAGFALTALPEFTGLPSASRARLRQLALLWLAARLGFWLSGLLGLPALWLAAIGQVGFALLLLGELLPALRSPDGRRHAAFGWLVLALAGTAAGFYVDALRGQAGLRWLYATLGVLMLLIVVAASRISMRVVNRAIEDLAPGADAYLARPPRRHLASFAIGLYTAAEWAQQGTHLCGWLALAAGAAVLNLLGDWHVGAPLWRRRFPLMLYAMYWCMALGYVALGLSQLDLLPGGSIAGHHLLAMGAMGLAIFVVCSIAGRAHVGLASDTGPWLGLGAALLLLATFWRAGAALLGADMHQVAFAGVLWCAAYAVLLWRVGPGLWRPRTDGKTGCAD
ncbi:NnrS family protein [Comamonas faecalis]|uniref:NnrS family protein n=1 Tax=Comamonas faecalis TaxID=1387849 RepID=A0ABP7QFW4_9BURK